MLRVSLPKEPYRGLRFYEQSDAAIFAGRDIDATDCAELLSTTRLLVLHGRTGCGKSSFLRAGLAPFLERIGSDSCFMTGVDGNIRVIRSGAAPLAELAKTLWSVLEEYRDAGAPSGPFGCPTRPDQISKARLGSDDLDSFVDRLKRDSAATLKSMQALASAFSITPIFVIDQAEEVFTLVSNNESVILGRETFSGDRLLEQQSEYFQFLAAVANEDTSCRVIVSLRSEYKGRLDDHISDASRAALARTRGFFLEDLDQEGLVEAIIRPTLTFAELSDIDPDLAEQLGSSQDPQQKYGFVYEEGVAEKIAEDLNNEEAIPVGGILPTMQLICQRLYRQQQKKRSYADKSEPKSVIRISRYAWSSMGRPVEQIENYLRNSVSEFLRNYVGIHLEEEQEQFANWMLLLMELVNVEPDGRVVTKECSRSELVERAAQIGCLFTRNDNRSSSKDAISERLKGGIDFFCKPKIGLLRRTRHSANSSNREHEYYTLGHDAIGLALQRWSIKANWRRERASMNMGDAMNSISQYTNWEIMDLYEPDDLPKKYDVLVAADMMWDHQIPLFAEKFARRLGLDFIRSGFLTAAPIEAPDTSPSQTKDATNRHSIRPKSQAELFANAESLNRENPGRVLVASERSAFPPQTAGKTKLNWSDIAVSDLFLGNSLVGLPNLADKDGLLATQIDLRGKRRDDAPDFTLAAWEMELRRILEFMIDNSSTVWCYDESGRKTIELAAKISGLEVADTHSINFKYLDTKSEFASVDQLFEKYDREIIAFQNGPHRSVFMVGTAFGQAQAIRSSQHVIYFGPQDLWFLINLKRRTRVASSDDTLESIENQKASYTLRDDFRKIGFHTLWQVGVPQSRWNKSPADRAFILRLASVAYFSAEAIVSDPMRWVDYILNWTDRFEGSSGLPPSAVEHVLKECINLFRFEEVSRVFFDASHDFSFRPADHAFIGAGEFDDYHFKSSVAFQVFQELLDLRRRTIEHFSVVQSSIEWIDSVHPYWYENLPFKLKSDIIKALRVKTKAWRHYQIFNFYDSERLMSISKEEIRRIAESLSD